MEAIIKSEYINGPKRLEPKWTLEELAKKLEPVTGIPPQAQKFEFTSEAGTKIDVEQTPPKTLESLGLQPGWEIYVVDTRPDEDKLDLTSESEKFEIPLEEYEKRENTLLQWKKANKLGRFADKPNREDDDNDKNDDDDEDDEEKETRAEYLSLPLHSECFVRTTRGTVRGTVEFIGKVPEVAPGTWVGMRLVSPSGRNNGTVKGVHLFDAEPNHGILVRPWYVRPLDDDEEEL